jgi:uridylate kinase
MKATQVDGVYTADPHKDPSARRYDRLTHDEAIVRQLAVMDTAAFALARDNKIPIIVFSIREDFAIRDALVGTRQATIVEPGEPARA